MVVADDDGSAIILQGLGHDFRGRCGGAVDEDEKGAFPDGFPFDFPQMLQLARVVFDRNDDPFIDEKAGDGDSLRQESARIAAQIEDDPFEFMLFFDLLEGFADI